MIVGSYWREIDDFYANRDLDNRNSTEKLIRDFDLTPSGSIEKTHYSNPNLVRKVIWFD